MRAFDDDCTITGTVLAIERRDNYGILRKKRFQTKEPENQKNDVMGTLIIDNGCLSHTSYQYNSPKKDGHDRNGSLV